MTAAFAVNGFDQQLFYPEKPVPDFSEGRSSQAGDHVTCLLRDDFVRLRSRERLLTQTRLERNATRGYLYHNTDQAHIYFFRFTVLQGGLQLILLLFSF